SCALQCRSRISPAPVAATVLTNAQQQWRASTARGQHEDTRTDAFILSIKLLRDGVSVDVRFPLEASQIFTLNILQVDDPKVK
ncbi:hypothetical protein WMY93_032236, partial [Mugilogobius chulae]